MAGEKTILVVGGGIAGITAALEAAEAGSKVILVEKLPYLGGRVARIHKYFPKLCPPTCGLEINFKRIRNNPDLTVYTLAEVENITGTAGFYTATIKVNPRYVRDHAGTSKCVEDCPVEIPNDFNYAMDKCKAVYQPYEMAYPMGLVADGPALKKAEGKPEVERVHGVARRKGYPVDLDEKAETFQVTVNSVVWATGWKPYDATKLDTLGFGKCANVITNVMMERLAAPNGPTKGQIVRPSDGKKVNSVAFVQCAGSRDRNHLPYCSSICCLASLKQSTYLRDFNPDAKATVFYIDLRAYGRFEFFFDRVTKDENISLNQGQNSQHHRRPGHQRRDSGRRRHPHGQPNPKHLRYGSAGNRHGTCHQNRKSACARRDLRRIRVLGVRRRDSPGRGHSAADGCGNLHARRNRRRFESHSGHGGEVNPWTRK